MDFASGASKYASSDLPHQRHNENTLDDGGESSSGSNGAQRPRETLGRWHSDTDVLASGLGPYSSMVNTGERNGEEQTWIDFLREAPTSAGGDDDRQAQVEARRATLMAVDRKRRLTAYQGDITRRRSSGGTYGQLAGGPRRTINVAPRARSEHVLTRSGLVSNHTTGPADQPRSFTVAPTAASSRNRAPTQFVLPRWQPDSEVSKCPICGTQFSFWYRKHHCRKCGRVVCAGCSPHRITIPRQFIVHPPTDPSTGSGTGFSTGRSSGVEVVDLTGDEDEEAAQASTAGQPHGLRRHTIGNDTPESPLGGGQEVRLCNPCVPDPNPSPPPAYPASTDAQYMRPPPSLSRARPAGAPAAAPNHTQQPSRRPSGPINVPTTAVSSQPTTDTPVPADTWANLDGSVLSRGHRHSVRSLLRRRSREAVWGSDDATERDGGPQFYPPSYFGELRNPLYGAVTSVPTRHSSTYGSAPGSSANDQAPHNRPHHHARHRAHASTSTVHPIPRYRSMLDVDIDSPLPVPPPAARPPVLREEDECPICHLALPPHGPDGSEAARERHVAACIESHFSSSTPRTSHPPPAVALAAASSASAATPSQASGIDAGPDPRRPTPTPRRAPAMLVYQATEKDCVTSDGVEAQECVICFEEFAVGDEMGRLECLCKFHRACIRAWWDTKGVGACPVHQGGI